METNPAIWISLLGALLTAGSVFGMALTQGKIQAIMGVATIAIPLVIGLVTRKNVYSPQSAQTALNMPQGSSMTLLNKVLAADVPVFAGDTQADVARKVQAGGKIAQEVQTERKSKMKAHRLLITSLVLTLILACGVQQFATTFRVVVAAGAPVLTRLEQQGKISHDLHVVLSTDLTNEASEISRMSGCFDGILKDDPQSKSKHLQCVQVLANSAATRKLITDFSASDAVSNIADDFSAILEAASIFYGGVNKNAPRVAGSTAGPETVTEADIKAKIAKLKKDLQGK